jgi:hypothetical protein
MGRAKDPLLSWILDRAADAIERSPEGSQPASRLGRSIAKFTDAALLRFGGRGAWTAGLELMEKGRWKAASVAFEDAVKGFEGEVGHDHVWTAHALARQGWCYLQLNQPEDALRVSREAFAIATGAAPDDADLLEHLNDLVRVAGGSD